MSKPGILLVGSFDSRERKGSRQVCEELRSRLAGDGYLVTATSGRTGKISRIFDMVGTAVRRRKDYSVAQIDVFSGFAFIWAEIVTAVLRKIGKPYILTLHGGELPAFGRSHPRRLTSLLKSARVVTCPSPYLKESLRWAHNEIRLVPNGLDIGLYLRPENEKPGPRLCWLRAYHRLYNPMLAVSVVEALINKHPEIQLTMNGPDKGDGSLGEVRQEVIRKGLGGRVHVGGRVAKADVPATLAAGDIFLNTTDADNAPVSVIEAMASGLCVVSTNVGGIPFLLKDGENALLVPPRDVQAMSTAVSRLLEDSELASVLARNGRELAKGHDWSVVLPQWEGLLAEVGGCG